jgi:molybdopterin converting factor small subunit
MPVTVRLFAAARAAAGISETSAPPGSLQSVLDGLVSNSPALATVLPRCSYLIDGVATHEEPSHIEVGEGSEVDVLPPFAGG